MVSSITPREVIAMMVAVSEKMIDSLELLTEADKMGDGDHGIGMKRGFEAVLLKLESVPISTETSLKSIFTDIGTAIMMNSGGASGAIFGTMFRSGGKGLEGQIVLNSESFAKFLKNGVEGVMDRGKAKPGDKTVIDALLPAAFAAEHAAREKKSLDETLKVAALAASEGLEETKKMVATTGKAKTLGERTLGHIDPGALSVSIILDTMCKWLENK